MSEQSGHDVGLFNRDFFRHVETIRAVLRYAPPDSHPRILDIASGVAFVSRVLISDYGYRVFAADCPLTYGHELMKRTSVAMPTVAIWQLGMESLPFKDESADVILFLATIEHLRDSPRPILQEFHRVLKPGGILIIDTPNILELRKRLMLLFGQQIMPSIQFIYNTRFHCEHHREYTLDDLVNVLKWSKFQMIEARVLDTLSGLTIARRIPHKQRTIEGGEYEQMTRWDVGFHPLRFYGWAKLPFALLVKILPNLGDTLFAVARKA